MNNKCTPQNPTAGEWQSVTHSMPDSDQTVLIHHPANDEPVWLGYHDGETWRDVAAEQVHVSHWMDLPSPPESYLEIQCRDSHGALDSVVRIPRNAESSHGGKEPRP